MLRITFPTDLPILLDKLDTFVAKVLVEADLAEVQLIIVLRTLGARTIARVEPPLIKVEL
jgi:hypothetical protein